MGLKSIGSKIYGTVAGEYKLQNYTADLIFPHEKLFENWEVAEFLVRENDNYDFLIGMDIIKMGDLAITNADGKMMFSFRIPPAEKHTDYQYELLKETYSDEEIEELVKNTSK